MSNPTSILDLVRRTLSAAGMPVPGDLCQTLVIENGSFIGHRYHFDGGHAMWAEGWDTVSFYDEDGKLLKMVAVKSGTRPSSDQKPAARVWNRFWFGSVLLMLGLGSAVLPMGCDTGAPDMPGNDFKVKDDTTPPRRPRDDPFVFDPRIYAKPPDKSAIKDDSEPPAATPTSRDNRDEPPRSGKPRTDVGK